MTCVGASVPASSSISRIRAERSAVAGPVSGSFTSPIAPASAPVAPGSVLSRRDSSDVASAASATLRARNAAPPRRAWKSIATSTLSQALQSRVPVQSNSARNPPPKPCEIVTGCSPACRSGAAHRNPQPLDAHSHLWQLPTYQSAPQRAQVERHLARPVRAIHQHRHAGVMARRDDALQRQHQCAARGDVVDHRELACDASAPPRRTRRSHRHRGGETAAPPRSCARRHAR